MSAVKSFEEVKECSSQYILAVNDTLNVMSGKWKLPIIAALLRSKKRFKELEADIEKITPRMLSKELKELELNGIVLRTVHTTKPVLIEYQLTKSGQKLSEVIDAMVRWGLEHRKVTISK